MSTSYVTVKPNDITIKQPAGTELVSKECMRN